MSTATIERATKASVRVGSLLMSTYGCTMHRATYWQVLKIEGSKVYLGKPESTFEGTGYDAGHEILIGPSVADQQPCRKAKLTPRGLKLCRDSRDSMWGGKEWQVSDSHWDYLKHVSPGHREYTYGD